MFCNKPRSSLFFSGIELLLGIAGLTAILLVTLGVITRFVFQISIAWSDELLRTVFVWAYFIGTALLYRANGGLMRLELLEDYLKGKKTRRTSRCSAGFFDDVIFRRRRVLSVRDHASAGIVRANYNDKQHSCVGFSVGLFYRDGPVDVFCPQGPCEQKLSESLLTSSPACSLSRTPKRRNVPDHFSLRCSGIRYFLL